MIKRFKISKLFGIRTVDIPFDDEIKILIGENGLGKTTVLNCLYYILTSKYKKLNMIQFDRIELHFDDNRKIKFTKRELESFLDFKSRSRKSRIPPSTISKIDFDEIKIIIENEEDFEGNDLNRMIYKYLSENNIPRWAPASIMIREIRFLVMEPQLKKFVDFESIIDSFGVSVLYFPTYRRVEEDLKNIGQFRRRKIQDDFDLFDEENDDDPDIDTNTIIHFGMEDVVNRIESVKDYISNSTVDGFSKVTGEILSQLLKGFPEIEKTQIDNLDIDTAKIVLHRVGDSLSKADRNQILKLLEDPLNLLKKKELTYFLINLIEIYNRHKHIDDSVKKFRDVCNNYLEDKEIRYNESSVDIKVYRKKTNDSVDLRTLSSGEKQIVSLFSKVYLEQSGNYIVLFDEPELSLSIEWQKLLLPDIVSSEKCRFLLSVTHSPFIFKNRLDEYAVGMNAYIK